MDNLISILKEELSLKDSHCKIIEALRNEELNVRKLVSKTKISIGTIYELLDYLVSNNLIKVKNTHKKIYYIDDFENSIIYFIDKQIEIKTKSRERILNKINTNNQKIKSFEDDKEFKLECIKEDPLPIKVKGLITNFRYPIFLYPEKFEDYVIVKEIILNLQKAPTKYNNMNENKINIKKYRDLLENSKGEQWIFLWDELEIFLNELNKKSKKLYDETILKLKTINKKYNLEFKITRSKRVYQYIITPNSLQTRLSENTNSISMLIIDRKTIDIHLKLFSELWNESESINFFLKNHQK